LSHQINDSIVDCINDEWDDMTRDLKDWLETHKKTDEIADRVNWAFTYLENKWKQERFDSYPDS
tara:strand:+ start:219 stop:410 length:192 start_codon:yes stop_codon:yes gene_type:complete